VGQEELSQYLMQSASQYGMEPSEFIQSLQENKQIPSMVGEVARSKSLSVALAKVTVKDSQGAKVDLSSVINTSGDAVESAIAQAVADSVSEDEHHN